MQPDFEQLWNALPQPALLIDGSDRIAEMNAAAQDFLAASLSQLRGRPIRRYVGETSPVMELLAQARQGRGSLAQYNIDLGWAERPPQLVDLVAAPLHESDGAILLTIQARSMAEKMDRRMSHRSAARSVAGLAAMLAHEIKNPLAGISGAAQLLAMSLPDSERELTDLICGETARIGALIDDVERFGDIPPVTRRPVNLHDVIDRARRSAEAGFASHVRFIEEFDPSLPPTAGDADQLMQVMLNLIKNAAEATPEIGGVIALSTSYRTGLKLALPGGGHEGLPLQVTVSDNGRGVPEELRHDIFEPFVSSKTVGSGLGLALVSKIVSEHGGVVECDSRPGWTSFRLLLPVWDARRHASGGDVADREPG
ncbi:MAG: PAS domain-containing protein [Alphaproteobacteria bacterium]|nr:MAG: PAS domain-containing protein [Alphaproteobacteria bacterium]